MGDIEKGILKRQSINKVEEENNEARNLKLKEVETSRLAVEEAKGLAQEEAERREKKFSNKLAPMAMDDYYGEGSAYASPLQEFLVSIDILDPKNEKEGEVVRNAMKSVYEFLPFVAQDFAADFEKVEAPVYGMTNLDSRLLKARGLDKLKKGDLGAVLDELERKIGSLVNLADKDNLHHEMGSYYDEKSEHEYNIADAREELRKLRQIEDDVLVLRENNKIPEEGD